MRVKPPGKEFTNIADLSPPEETKADWPSIIKDMGLNGLTLELANHCILRGIEDNFVELAMDPKTFSTPQRVSNLEKALQDYFNRPVKLRIDTEKPIQDTPADQIQRRRQERQKTAELEIDQDPIVLALKERLDARIVPGSIKPLD